jgi:hypothetical protein
MLLLNCSLLKYISHFQVERFLAACAACAIGESVRDAGGDALVVVDDLSVLSDMWEVMSVKWNLFMDNDWEAERAAKYDILQAKDGKPVAPKEAMAAEGDVEVSLGGGEGTRPACAAICGLLEGHPRMHERVTHSPRRVGVCPPT